MISSVSRPCTGCGPTGIPRPLSSTVTESSAWTMTEIVSQYPAWASSIALSTSSVTMWWRPEMSSVFPMYIPGRLRTASSPLRSLIELVP